MTDHPAPGLGLPTGRVRIPEGVARRGFGDDTVLLNLKTGQYHGLNGIGSAMLDTLEETGDAAETARRIAAEYGVEEQRVASDLAELCGQLLERGLIAVDER